MMQFYASFDGEGFPRAFWNSEIYPPTITMSERPADAGEGWAPDVLSTERHPAIPGDATEITEAQWREFIENQGQRRWQEGVVVVFDPPAPPVPEPGPVILPAGDFFDRTTEEEADAIDEAMTAQPVKFRRAWAAATVFRSDNDLWPVLRAAIADLYGEGRARELLAAPTAEMMRAVAQ